MSKVVVSLTSFVAWITSVNENLCFRGLLLNESRSFFWIPLGNYFISSFRKRGTFQPMVLVGKDEEMSKWNFLQDRYVYKEKLKSTKTACHVPKLNVWSNDYLLRIRSPTCSRFSIQEGVSSRQCFWSWSRSLMVVEIRCLPRFPCCTIKYCLIEPTELGIENHSNGHIGQQRPCSFWATSANKGRPPNQRLRTKWDGI